MRGRIWIHASSGTVTRAEYENFVAICRYQRIKKFPARKGFQISGIVGSAEIVDCVTKSRSYWFGGERGFVLRSARRTRFKPMKGKLGFFEVKPQMGNLGTGCVPFAVASSAGEKRAFRRRADGLLIGFRCHSETGAGAEVCATPTGAVTKPRHIRTSAEDL